MEFIALNLHQGAQYKPAHYKPIISSQSGGLLLGGVFRHSEVDGTAVNDNVARHQMTEYIATCICDEFRCRCVANSRQRSVTASLFSVYTSVR